MLPRFHTSAGKTYDSATAYDKATPYYGGFISGVYPQMLNIKDVKPSMASFVFGNTVLPPSYLLYDTHALFDTHQFYESPGVTNYLDGEVPRLTVIDNTKPQLEYML